MDAKATAAPTEKAERRTFKLTFLKFPKLETENMHDIWNEMKLTEWLAVCLTDERTRWLIVLLGTWDWNVETDK